MENSSSPKKKTGETFNLNTENFLFDIAQLKICDLFT